MADPKRRARVRLSSRLKDLLRVTFTKKKNSILHYLGCSHAEFTAHLQSQFRDGMTWQNYGRTGWHIDHIIPCAAFDLSQEDHVHVCFHYSNLQPLWWSANVLKSDNLQSYIPQHLKDKAFAVGVLIL